MTKSLEENRDRKQKSQPTRSKSGTKYTACSLDSVFLQKEKEDGHGIVVAVRIDDCTFCRNIVAVIGDLRQKKKKFFSDCNYSPCGMLRRCLMCRLKGEKFVNKCFNHSSAMFLRLNMSLPMGGPTVSVTLYPLSLIRLTMSPWWRVLMSTWFTARIRSPTCSPPQRSAGEPGNVFVFQLVATARESAALN